MGLLDIEDNMNDEEVVVGAICSYELKPTIKTIILILPHKNPNSLGIISIGGILNLLVHGLEIA